MGNTKLSIPKVAKHFSEQGVTAEESLSEMVATNKDKCAELIIACHVSLAYLADGQKATTRVGHVEALLDKAKELEVYKEISYMPSLLKMEFISLIDVASSDEGDEEDDDALSVVRAIHDVLDAVFGDRAENNQPIALGCTAQELVTAFGLMVKEDNDKLAELWALWHTAKGLPDDDGGQKDDFLIDLFNSGNEWARKTILELKGK